jgi:hypothetical protein
MSWDSITGLPNTPLIFQYKFARSICSVIQVASNLYLPCSATNNIGNWLNGIDRKFKTLTRGEALAVIWSLWLCRNNKVFNDKNSFYEGYLPVHPFDLFMVIYNLWNIKTFLQMYLHGWRT